jgi:Predicted nucleoside-diphosphate sugar epimerases
MVNRKGKRMLEPWQILSGLMAVYDFVAIHGAFLLALLARFDFKFGEIPDAFWLPYTRFITVYALGALVVFWFFRMYRSLWAYASFAELVRALEACLITGVAHIIGITVLFGRMPISYYFGGVLLQTVLVVGIRFSYRFILYERSKRQPAGGAEGRIMLIGAGDAGQMILRDLSQVEKPEDKAVCIIDDDPSKWGRYLENVPVVGGRDDILLNVKKYHVNKIFLAIPSASEANKRDILGICSQTDCELKQLPGMYQFLTGQITVAAMKEVSVEDLLGREPIQADMREVFDFIHGKRVLVTGGGGSIGSELCRQIAANRPKKLIILDIYENNAYDIQQELLRTYGRGLDMCVEIASVRDKAKIYSIVEKYLPNIIFHAAAHKHVPLMEHNPEEAVKNNIFGTYHVVRAAEKYGVQKFVMISTDKAVNPTNVMGASKRFCEMILQSRRNSLTEYCSVRFGNVLGSNGSVVPLFEKQIAAGGPITITDKRITRFFMTIPEAVQLVMEAGAMAGQNQIFVLDMGQPVKILTLAENMIRLHGLTPYKDIDIVEIGLRPGEKLYEELLMKSEKLTRKGDKIFVEEQEDIDPDRIREALEKLDEAVTGEWDEERLTALLRQVVTTFKTPEEVNRDVETVPC